MSAAANQIEQLASGLDFAATGDSVVAVAVDRKEQGRGLGSHLLRDAIGRCVQAADSIGVRAILVHALHDEARAFYAHFEFEVSPTDPLHLMLLMKDARALIGG